MVLKLTAYIRNVISFSYKPKIPVNSDDSELFLAKISTLAYISLKIGHFELGHDYDVTVTSCWYLFWYVWKERSPSYTMVPMTYIWGSFLSSQGGG